MKYLSAFSPGTGCEIGHYDWLCLLFCSDLSQCAANRDFNLNMKSGEIAC